MTRLHRLALAAALLLLAAGCASIPGDTGTEQAMSIEDLEQRTLADVQAQDSTAAERLAHCVGYVIMSNKLTKIPLVGVGAGYGVAVERASGERTYLRMRRFDVGLGVGVRAVRPMLIFADSVKFRRYIDGDFDAKVGAEASAKVGERGSAGGASGGAANKANEDQGYTSYLVTDSGVSATASLAIIRVKRIKLKK
jgi:hypothetical protein